MATDADALAALDGLATGALDFSPPEVVLCRVCDTNIDKTSGDPVEPVTTDAVAAVQQYLSESGQAEEGGVALI